MAISILSDKRPPIPVQFAGESEKSKALVRREDPNFDSRTAAGTRDQVSRGVMLARQEWDALTPLKKSGIKAALAATLVTVAVNKEISPILRAAAGVAAAALLASAGFGLFAGNRQQIADAAQPIDLPKAEEGQDPVAVLKQNLATLAAMRDDLNERYPDERINKAHAMQKALVMHQIAVTEKRIQQDLELLDPAAPKKRPLSRKA